MTAPNHIPNFDAIEKAVRVAVKQLVHDVETFADGRRTDFVRKIQAQKFPSFKAHPLSALYLARKRAHDADNRVLIATAHYLSEIKRTTEQLSKNKYVVAVSIAPDAVAHDLDDKPTTTSLNMVARVLEKGSSACNIPPRPHWQPFIFETKILLRRWRIKEAGNLARLAQQNLTVGIGPARPAA